MLSMDAGYSPPPRPREGWPLVPGQEDAGLPEGCVGGCAHTSDAALQGCTDTQELQGDDDSVARVCVNGG